MPDATPDALPMPDRPAPTDPDRPSAAPLQPARRAVTVDPPAPIRPSSLAPEAHDWDYLVP